MSKEIKGYNTLTKEQVNKMNEIKALSEELGKAVNSLLHDDATDAGWVQKGQKEIQTGVMCVIRGITKPSGFA